jgi:hypothetical protein
MFCSWSSITEVNLHHGNVKSTNNSHAALAFFTMTEYHLIIRFPILFIPVELLYICVSVD